MKGLKELLAGKADVEAPKGRLRLNPRKLALSVFSKTKLDDEDFLSADSDHESDQYEDATGLEDDETRIEGTGDKRAAMVRRAMAKSRNR